MDLLGATLRQALGENLADPARTWWVALSGGLDSSVLLHALACMRPGDLRGTLRAVHVDHQLQAGSAEWAAACRAFCASLAVPLEIRVVEVDLRRGEGVEAAARRARYAALQGCLSAGDHLLTAHHRDDQAETLLLNLLRGSGVAGLGGIPAEAGLGGVTVHRPLLALPRTALLDYARRHGLSWIEDPANRDERMDRNYLRRIVLPALVQRWPAAHVSVARSAGLCAEAATLLADLAARDLGAVMRRGQVLVPALRSLPDPRQRNLLRQLCRQAFGSVPNEARLREGLAQLLRAAADRSPIMVWPGGEIRRYRDRLYLLPTGWNRQQDALRGVLQPGAALDLGAPRGRLRLVSAKTGGIAAALLRAGLQVRFRQGGERLRPAGQAHHRELKTLLQERGVVPWMREHVPLLVAGERIVAVADLWVAAEYAAPAGEPAYRVRWDRHPALA
jgi:tRNA(Ile)-lysidine synthase